MTKTTKKIPALRFPEFKEEWEEKKLRDVFDLKYGKNYKHLTKGTIPLIGTGGIMGWVNEYLYNKESVLIGRKGSITKPQFIKIPFWTVDTLFYTEIKSEYIPYFVFLIVSNINWLKYNEATGVPSLNTVGINNVEILITKSINEQQKIAHFLTSVDEKIQQLTKKKTLLEQYKKGVMQQIFLCKDKACLVSTAPCKDKACLVSTAPCKDKACLVSTAPCKDKACLVSTAPCKDKVCLVSTAPCKDKACLVSTAPCKDKACLVSTAPCKDKACLVFTIPCLRFKDDNGNDFPEWEEKTLGEIAKVYDGTHFTPNYVSEGIPFYSVEQVTANDFINTKFISREVFKKENERVTVEKGDILMTKIGDIGTSKYIDWEVEASFYVSLALIKQSKKYNSKFLNQYIKSIDFQQELHKRIIHVAFPRKINLGEISNCFVNLPCFSEQQKIADFLSGIDNKIEQCGKMLSKYLEWKKGLLQGMFV
jgi:restriction endonuclease S subunit